MTPSPALDRDRFRGALLGLAAGDAVGTTVEFKPPGTFPRVTDMTGGGPFRLPPGAWTDDTSMALCLAESLVERRGFDPVDQLERYVRWYRDGHWSSTGRCFDIGNATRAALERFERAPEPFPGDAAPRAAGNGPLMKLAPVALAYAADPAEAIRCAALSARTTHGAPEAADACRYFAGLLVGALRGVGVEELLADAFEPVAGLWQAETLHPKIAAVAAGAFHVKEPPAIRGGGYVVDALEAALWALRSSRSFEEGVLAAVNLGDDADTTAAIYGQLAGALYGVDAIPGRWRERLVMHDEIVALADALFELAHAGPAVDEPTAGNAVSRTQDAAHDPSPSAPPRRPDDASPSVPPPPTPHDPSPSAPPPGDSYWVLPGRLLAGPYPGAPTKRAAQEKLDAFLDAGVTCFVDLTEEGEGPPLHPYSALLRRRAARRGVHVTHLRLPIRDVDVPTSWQMRAILAAIRLALDDGETVYVHCWGGVGRTGTVIGCHLVEAGTAPAEVLARLVELRKETARAHRASPETAAQERFIADWASAAAAALQAPCGSVPGSTHDRA
jgi:ADP-ribosylglycohydrolase